MKPPSRSKNSRHTCSCSSGKQPKSGKKNRSEKGTDPTNTRKRAQTEKRARAEQISKRQRLAAVNIQLPLNTQNDEEDSDVSISIPSSHTAPGPSGIDQPSTPQQPQLLPESDTDESDTSSDSDDDMFTFQDAVARHVNNVMAGNGIQFAEPISTPIINQVKRSICKQIWKNKFVDIAALLPSSQTPSPTQYTLQVDNNSQFTTNPTTRARKISNIETWTTAFLRFMAVYLYKFPLESQQLLKYMEVVRDIARRRPRLAFSYYDTQFRMLRESTVAPCDRIDTEYWLMACTSFQQNPQSFRFQQPYQRNNSMVNSKRFLEKTCWNYNKRSQ